MGAPTPPLLLLPLPGPPPPRSLLPLLMLLSSLMQLPVWMLLPMLLLLPLEMVVPPAVWLRVGAAAAMSCVHAPLVAGCSWSELGHEIALAVRHACDVRHLPHA